MPIPRLDPDECALLVIDVQERLIGTIHRSDLLVRRASALVQGCALLKIPVIATEQYVRGLGPTVASLAASFPTGTPVFGKEKFSALIPAVTAELSRLKRRTLLVCGIEAHVCVLQTVLDACTQGIQPFHVTDAISAGQPDQIAPALSRMERAGSIPTGCVSALYELMGSCDNPVFKPMLPIAKAIISPSD
jgi:nicotinamidase-related amidase